MQLEISREERRLLLGVLIDHAGSLPESSADKKLADALVERLLDPPGTLYSAPVSPTSGAGAGPQVATGSKPAPASAPLAAPPAGAEEMTLTPTGIKNYEKRILVSTPGTTLSCWKKELFDAVRARLNKSTTFYVVRKERYLNIIGLKP